MIRNKQKQFNLSDEIVRGVVDKRALCSKDLINQVGRVLAAKKCIDLWDGSEVMRKKAVEKYQKEKELLLVFAGAYDGANSALKNVLRKEHEHMSYTPHFGFQTSDELVFEQVLAQEVRND